MGGVQERGPIAGSSWPAKPLAAQNTRCSEGKLIASQPPADYRIHKTTAWSSLPLFPFFNFFYFFYFSHKSLALKSNKKLLVFVLFFLLNEEQNRTA